MNKRFILLDRDGTIIVEKKYLSDPNGVELIPSAATALKKLKSLGFGLIVIANQAGVGRGYFTLKTLDAIHERLKKLLKEEGVTLDGIYFCPHHPEDNCSCRKPKTGMVEKAIKKFKFDTKDCFVVGDKRVDIELGKNIGAKTILVKTGYGKEFEKEKDLNPDYVVDDLSGIVSIVNENF